MARFRLIPMRIKPIRLLIDYALVIKFGISLLIPNLITLIRFGIRANLGNNDDDRTTCGDLPLDHFIRFKLTQHSRDMASGFKIGKTSKITVADRNR
jgi:hypothetical protein